MADDKHTLSDDEFHFSEAEETENENPYTFSDSSSEDKKSRFNRKNILIAIGVIVVALAIYKLLGVFFGASETKKNTAITATTTQNQTNQSSSNNQPETSGTTDTANQAGVTAQNVSQTPSVQIQSNVSKDEFQDQLSQIQQKDDSHSQQIAEVDNEVESLKSTLNTLQTAINNMNNQLEQMGVQLQSQQGDISNLEAKLKKSKARTKVAAYTAVKKPAVKRSRWWVQAVIPGRAWLIDSQGKTMTVKVGDVLSGYGRVRSISVLESEVKLANGAILSVKGI